MDSLQKPTFFDNVAWASASLLSLPTLLSEGAAKFLNGVVPSILEGSGTFFSSPETEYRGSFLSPILGTRGGPALASVLAASGFLYLAFRIKQALSDEIHIFSTETVQKDAKGNNILDEEGQPTPVKKLFSIETQSPPSFTNTPIFVPVPQPDKTFGVKVQSKKNEKEGYRIPFPLTNNEFVIYHELIGSKIGAVAAMGASGAAALLSLSTNVPGYAAHGVGTLLSLTNGKMVNTFVIAPSLIYYGAKCINTKGTKPWYTNKLEWKNIKDGVFWKAVGISLIATGFFQWRDLASR